MAVLHHTGMKITTNTSIVDTFREKLRSLCIQKVTSDFGPDAKMLPIEC